MKRFLLLTALILPGALYARCFELRGFGGLMMNSGTWQSTFGYERSGLNALGGIGASYRRNRLEFGIAAAYRRLSFQRTIPSDKINPLTGYVLGPPETTLVYRQPAFTLAPVFNYHFGSGKLDWYAGLSPAFVRFFSQQPAAGEFERARGKTSFSIEGQIGCRYELAPKLSCFAEICGGTFARPYLWTGSLNLGAAFRIGGTSNN